MRKDGSSPDKGDNAVIPQPSYASQMSSVLTPPYHWFLLDHCFLFASDSEPKGDVLVPAYFLVRFCINSLGLANCVEDWSVFDGLFFALHFEMKVCTFFLFFVFCLFVLMYNSETLQVPIPPPLLVGKY
jgi:hypothetical protein